MKSKIAFVILLLFFAYLLFYPVKITPEKYTALPIPELTGKFEANSDLAALEVIFKGECQECEDVDMDAEGNIYGSAVDGKIMKFVHGKSEVFAETNGRPLGMHFDSNQNLIVCDAQKGLLSIDPAGKITVLATEHNGLPFKFTDDVDIASNGVMYFTDASHKFHNEEYVLDFIEHGANGRLLSYHPESKVTTLLLDNLYFANGVAVSPDDSFVLVNETSQHQIRKYWLDGNKAGTSEIILENLPFYPDGISRGENGIFWVAMQSPRNKLSESLSKYPFVRKMVARLPAALLPKPKNYSYVLGINGDGEIIHNFQDPEAKFAQITSIHQVGNQLYLGSLSENGIGFYQFEISF
jgi:sugar lactone lactonase YvrE